MKRTSAGARAALGRLAARGRRPTPVSVQFLADRVVVRHRDGRRATAELSDHNGQRATALAAAFRELPGAASRRVRIVLPASAVERHALQLPWPGRWREHNAVLRLKVRHELPRHTPVWAYRITHQRRGSGELGDHQLARLHAIPARIVDDLARLVADANLRLVQLHPSGQPECNFIRAPRIGPQGPVGLRSRMQASPLKTGATAVACALALAVLARETLPLAPEIESTAADKKDWDGTGHRAEAPPPPPPSPRARFVGLMDAVPDRVTLERVRVREDGALQVEGFALGTDPVHAYRDRLAAATTRSGPVWQTRAIHQPRPRVDRYGREVVAFTLERDADPARPPTPTPGPSGPAILDRVQQAGLTLLSAETTPLRGIAARDQPAQNRLSIRAEGGLDGAWQLLDALPARAPESLTLTVRDQRLRVHLVVRQGVSS